MMTARPNQQVFKTLLTICDALICKQNLRLWGVRFGMKSAGVYLSSHAAEEVQGELGRGVPGPPIHGQRPLQLHDLLQFLGRQSRQVIGQTSQRMTRPSSCRSLAGEHRSIAKPHMECKMQNLFMHCDVQDIVDCTKWPLFRRYSSCASQFREGDASPGIKRRSMYV